jgi:hypothetical protein
LSIEAGKRGIIAFVYTADKYTTSTTRTAKKKRGKREKHTTTLIYDLFSQSVPFLFPRYFVPFSTFRIPFTGTDFWKEEHSYNNKKQTGNSAVNHQKQPYSSKKNVFEEEKEAGHFHAQ